MNKEVAKSFEELEMDNDEIIRKIWGEDLDELKERVLKKLWTERR